MKKTISVLMIICILISTTTLVFANVFSQNDGTIYCPTSSAQSVSFDSITYDENDCYYIDYENADSAGITERSNPFIPSSVDLSNLLDSYLPDIADQGNGNNYDAAFASTYYQYTYESNRASGMTTTTSNTYCPQFTFSLTYDSYYNRSSLKRCYQVLNSLGCLRYEDYSANVINSFSDSTCFRRYCSDNTSARLTALRRRPQITGLFVESTDSVSFYTSVDIDGIKTYYACEKNYIIDLSNNSNQTSTFDNVKDSLYHGRIITIECNGSWDIRQKNNGNTVDYVIVSANAADNKALTIVGYDDNFAIDLNGNGTYELCEKGAFLAVDSHGSNAPYHNGGYIWILYDSFNKVGFNQLCNSSSRVPLLVEEKYYIKSYDPEIHDDVIVEMKRHLFYKINVIDRDLSVIGKISLTNSHVYSCTFSYVSSSLSGGYGSPIVTYPLTNSELAFLHNTYYTGDLLFDLSDYYSPIEDTYDYRLLWMKIQKRNSGTINISSVSLIDDKERTIMNVTSNISMNGTSSVPVSSEVSLIKGDIDYDGQISLSDKTLIQSYIVSNYDLSTLQFFLADMNGDGAVNVRDLKIITALINGSRDIEDYQD